MKKIILPVSFILLLLTEELDAALSPEPPVEVADDLRDVDDHVVGFQEPGALAPPVAESD